ncbi:MAG: DUF6256 family protein [Streptosporangiaceae bacterium]
MTILAVGLVLQRRQLARGSQPARRPAGRSRGWIGVAVNAARDMIGGYLLLMAVVIGYYYGVARVGSNFLDSAFSGSALLLAVVVPVFAGASALSWRREGKRAAGPGPDEGAADGASRGDADGGGADRVGGKPGDGNPGSG